MAKRDLSRAVNRAERRALAFGRYHDTHTPLKEQPAPRDPVKEDLYGRSELERILMGVGNEPVRDRNPSAGLSIPPYTYVARFGTQQCDHCKVKCHPFEGVFTRTTGPNPVYTRAILPSTVPVKMEVEPSVTLTPFCPNCRS